MKNRRLATGTLMCIMACMMIASGACASVETKLLLDYDLTQVDDDLRPGDSGLMTVVIRNVGSFDAENVEVYIPDAGDLMVGKRQYLGTLTPGSAQTVSTKFNVAGNASLGLRTIRVNVIYDGYDAYGKPEKDVRDGWEMNVNVKGDTIFVIDAVRADGPFTPGRTVGVEVSIRNKGTAGAYDAQVQLTFPTELVKVMGAEKQYMGDLESDGTKSFAYLLYLDDDLPPGAYSIPLAISYNDKDHASMQATLPVGIRVEGETKVTLTVSETDPKEIHAGDEEVEINVKLDNIGTNDIKNVKVSFVPQEPFRNAKSFVQSKDLGTLKASAGSEMTFYADIDEEAGPVRTEQAFTVTYQAGGGEYNKTFLLPIDIMDYPDLEVVADTVEAKIGMPAELRINVKNTGSDCESVTVWAVKKSDQPFDFEDKSDFVGDLDKGESQEAVIRFTVEDDGKPKEYSLPVEVRCTKDDEVLTFSDKVLINVTNGTASNTNTYAIGGIVLAAALLVGYGLKRDGGKGKR